MGAAMIAAAMVWILTSCALCLYISLGFAVPFSGCLKAVEAAAGISTVMFHGLVAYFFAPRRPSSTT